jgi:hypothetical protein
MKKIILTLILAIFSVLAFAQTQLPTYKNCVGYWNKTTQKYDFQDWVYADITFTFYDNYVSVNDAGHSIYRIMSNKPLYETETVKINSSTCLDEHNMECTVGIMDVKGHDDQTNIGVVYDGDRMFMYMLDIAKMRKMINQPDSRDLKSLN